MSEEQTPSERGLKHDGFYCSDPPCSSSVVCLEFLGWMPFAVQIEGRQNAKTALFGNGFAFSLTSLLPSERRASGQTILFTTLVPAPLRTWLKVPFSPARWLWPETPRCEMLLILPVGLNNFGLFHPSLLPLFALHHPLSSRLFITEPDVPSLCYF